MSSSIKTLLAAAAIASCAALAAPASAAVITNTPDSNVTGGVIVGTGNSNGGFNVLNYTDGTVAAEIGLRVQPRGPSADFPLGYIPPTPTTSTSYFVPTGNTGSGASIRSLWNYTFSIILTNTSFTSMSAIPTIIDNTTHTQSMVNLLGILDNAGNGTTEVQNSENLTFNGSGLAGYNPNALDTYTFNLALSGGALGGLTLVNTITATAVPEPTTLALLGTGLLGLGLLVRNRGRQAGGSNATA